MRKLLAGLCLLPIGGMAVADSWTPPVRLEFVEPLLNFQGGMVRVKVDTAVATPLCGTASVFEFMFTSGTQETRSAALAALYMALAADKTVKFYVSSTSCSPLGTPVITGLDVIK